MKIIASPARNNQGSVFVLSVLTLAILSFFAVNVLTNVTNRHQTSSQVSGWQEARLAAEAGVDAAMSTLNRNVPDPAASTTNWSGWYEMNDGTRVPANPITLTYDWGESSLTGNALLITPPVFLDNLDVSPASGIKAQVDVQVAALYPEASETFKWFKIRALGTASLPGPPRVSATRLDNALRRFSLHTIRPQLMSNDLGTALTIPTPNVSRIVEVLAKPIMPFALAILTDSDMTLGQSSNWEVDSYDSSDPDKSNPDGTYNFLKRQDNGDIASNKARPSNSPYGPLITANGAEVHGSAGTNGGDNPGTTAHENISGNGGIEPSRIYDDFYRDLTPNQRPTDVVITPNPASGSPHAPGTADQPNYYLYTGNLGAFKVSAPPAGTKGAVVIFVNGNLDVGSGNSALIEIPNDVTARIYIKGNIDFGNGLINMTSSSSKRPTNLQIYGEPSNGLPRTLSASGNPEVAAAFYGPDYDVTVNGTVDWYGSVVAKSYDVNGGGNGGFHYDEALATAGSITGFEIGSYIEDNRQ